MLVRRAVRLRVGVLHLLIWVTGLQLLLSRLAAPVRINSIQVPSAVMNASGQVALICNYDLQGEQLYSVKWYKNYVEFYRYLAPTAEASVGGSRPDFDLDGINLNLSKCNSTHVYLRNVLIASQGTYKCEVSIDSPFFTVSMERRMRVYVLPKQKPTIQDQNLPLQANQQASGSAATIYSINDTINLTCNAGHSQPPPKLRWLLNDLPVPKEAIQSQSNSELRSQLTLSLQPQHLLLSQTNADYDKLRFRCLARLELEFTSETKLVLSGGRATGLRRHAQQNSPTEPELPNPEPLQDEARAQLEADTSQPVSSANVVKKDRYDVYRWPPLPKPVWSTRAQVGRPEAELAPEPSTDLTSEPNAKRRPIGPGSYGRAWTNLKAQADYIDHVIRQTQPNQIDPPLVEARALWRRPVVGAWAPDELTQAGSMSASEYEPDDLVEFTCRPRVGQQTSGYPRNVQTRWFLNNQEIVPGGHETSRKVVFDGTKFELVPLEPEADVLEQESRLASGKDTTIQKHVIKTASEPTKLLVEFSSSIFQLKDLHLKCQTQIDQPFIEYESQPLVVQVATSNQFIQADKHSLPANPNRSSSSRSGSSARHQGVFHTSRRASQTGRNRHSTASHSSVFRPETGLLFLSCLLSSGLMWFRLV